MTEQDSASAGDLFFASLVSGYTAGNPRFLRRDWLAAEVNARLAAPDCRFLLLTAAPGAGKSTFVAQLAADHPAWLRYFIRRDQRSPLADVGAKSFLLRLGYQLAASSPDLFSQKQRQISIEQRLGSVDQSGEAVGVQVRRLLASPFYQKVDVVIRQQASRVGGKMVGLSVDELVIELRQLDTTDLAHMALIDPANTLLRLHPEQQLVILVDALDEVRYHEVADNILNWLTNCPDLPSNVRFVLSSRPPDAALRLFCDKQAARVRTMALAADDPRLQDDAAAYAGRLVGEAKMAAALAAAGTEAPGFAQRALAVARGNLGYLDAVARGIDGALARRDERALKALLALRELPQEIGGLYAFFLHQIQADIEARNLVVPVTVAGSPRPAYAPAWPELYKPLLSVLAVALQAVTPQQIAAFAAITAGRDHLLDALNRLGQFLDVADDRYRLYHATVAEFLTAAQTRDEPHSTDLYVDPVAWHGAIAEHYWQAHHPAWQGCDGYGLDSLATHLSRGGQGDRLEGLVSEAWMAARVEGDGYTYDGFLADVQLAWDHAHQQALAQTDAGQAPAALADCLRYALVRASINSLAANYVPALVVRALETGLWPAARATSVLRQAPDPERRAAMGVALLQSTALTAPARSQLERDTLAAARASRDYDGFRARALAALAALVAGQARHDVLREALAAARALIDLGGDPAQLLAALAPQLPGDLLPQAWAAARAIHSEADRARALAALAPQGPDQARAGLLADALAAIRAIGDEGRRADALAALAPQLSGDLLPEALAAARAIGPEWSRARALAALAPQLAGDLLPEALASARAIAGGGPRVQALAALAPQLQADASDALLRSALVEARSIEDGYARGRALAALAPRLVGDLLEQALAAARAIRDEGPRAKALAALAPYLADEPLQQALASAQELARQSDRAEALMALAPRLAGPSLWDAANAALEMEDGGYRVRVLAALLPRLAGEAREEALRWALAAVPDIEDEPGRAQALATLAPQLENPWLQRAWAMAQAIAYEGDRAQALAALAPHLAEPLLAEAVDAARAIGQERFRGPLLAALAPRLGGALLQEALDAGRAIGDEGRQVLALAALAPRLADQARAQAQQGALAAARAIGDQGSRARALAHLAPQLAGEIRADALRDAWAAAKTIGDERDRAGALEALAPHLDGPALREARAAAKEVGYRGFRAQELAARAPQLTAKSVREALAALRDIHSEEHRARALAALAPRLTGDLLGQALAAAQDIRHERFHARALFALAPRLEGDLLSQALAALRANEDEGRRALALAALAPRLVGNLAAEAAAMAREIGDPGRRAQALAALAPRLTGDLYQEALDAALTIGDEWPRAQALAALLPAAPHPAPLLGDIRRAMAEHLWSRLGSGGRGAVLAFCADEALVGPPILTPDILAQLARHIVEICRQWRYP